MLILTQDRFTTVNLKNIIKIYVKCGNNDDGENDNKVDNMKRYAEPMV